MGYTCIVPNCKTGYKSEKNKETQSFEDCEATIEFCLRINNAFDCMNRRFAKEGIRKDSEDLQVWN